MQYIRFISYAYFFIIIIFILFYLVIFIKDKINKKRLKKKNNLYKEIITKEIENQKKKNLFSKDHIHFLQKELTNVNNLLIFEEILTSLTKKEKEAVTNYCIQLTDVFAYLTQYYRKKSSMEKAYFSYVLSLFPMLMHDNDELLDYAMMHFVLDPSIYCRENAMLFFLSKGSTHQVINSLKKINKRNLYYSSKLLADDLLKFKGNHEKLITLLLKDFDEFSVRFQVAIIQYIRLIKEDRKEDLYQKLISKKYDKEVDLAIIRYFARYKYNKVLNKLITYMTDKNTYDFEYRIVAAFALASYDTKQVRKVLLDSLTDHNFYVSKNAAHSLSKMNISTEELKEAFQIEDSYAKEYLKNIWEEKKGVEKDEISVPL